jgi:two-component system response regulator MtrA
MMITSINDTDSRVRGLDLGADDYVGKPCAPDELLARVRALLRRPGRAPVAPDTLRLGDVTVDLAGRTARRGDQKLRLTRMDFALLRVLAAQRGQPVSRERIAAEVWGGVMTVQALNTHVWRLRAKLPPQPGGEPWIVNQPGLGYLLAAEA